MNTERWPNARIVIKSAERYTVIWGSASYRLSMGDPQTPQNPLWVPGEHS
jgi:hypothetical protein